MATTLLLKVTIRDAELRNKVKFQSPQSVTVSAFIMDIFITELNVFGLSSGPRQRNKIKAYINSKSE